MSDATASAPLSSSLEDYLEAILFLIRKARVARVRDIAHRVGVGMPAVTGALKTLSRRGLVNYDPYQLITLTDRGRELAERVAQRHMVLRRFLSDVLGLDEHVAEANACRIEHSIDAEVLVRLQDFAEFLQSCPRAGSAWIDRGRTCRHGKDAEQCRACIREAGVSPASSEGVPPSHSLDAAAGTSAPPEVLP